MFRGRGVDPDHHILYCSRPSSARPIRFEHLSARPVLARSICGFYVTAEPRPAVHNFRLGPARPGLVQRYPSTVWFVRSPDFGWVWSLNIPIPPIYKLPTTGTNTDGRACMACIFIKRSGWFWFLTNAKIEIHHVFLRS